MSEQITAYFSNIANGVKSFITGLSLTFEHFKNKKEILQIILLQVLMI